MLTFIFLYLCIILMGLLLLLLKFVQCLYELRTYEVFIYIKQIIKKITQIIHIVKNTTKRNLVVYFQSMLETLSLRGFESCMLPNSNFNIQFQVFCMQWFLNFFLYEIQNILQVIVLKSEYKINGKHLVGTQKSHEENLIWSFLLSWKIIFD